ncbi:MAG TPA: PilN domain-containing protein [Stellaceae bacterium]|nr:PilN domain-containing protein [Stellaceae bacterium]
MVREFFSWWFGQLAELLPQRLRRTDLTAADATVITPVAAADGDFSAVTVGLRRGGKETPLGRFTIGEPGLAGLPRSPGKPAVLRLGESEVLGKTLVLPLAAEREVDQALIFEMDRETPFGVEELYWNHRIEAADRASGRLSVRILLIPKARLDPLLAYLRQSGVVPARAEITDGPDLGSWLPLDGDGRPAHSLLDNLVRPAAIGCAALAMAAIVIPFARQSAAMAALDRQLAIGRTAAAEADSLRREIRQLSGSADLIQRERDKAGQPLAVLAAATRVMPDDSYLTELELLQRKLTISGRSAAAARLIAAFAANPEFRNPAFAAPVTRIEALHQEIFTIITEVAP